MKDFHNSKKEQQTYQIKDLEIGDGIVYHVSYIQLG
jgi:hypothetical protein